MTKSKEYDFNALLAMPSEDKLIDCMVDMWGAALRVGPKWNGRAETRWSNGFTTTALK